MPQKLFRRLIHARFNRSRHKTAEHFYTPIVDLNNQTRQLEVGSYFYSIFYYFRMALEFVVFYLQMT